MSPLLQAVDYREGMSDFSGGLVSGISERKIGNPKFVRRANNLIGRPHRAMSVRNGSRGIVTGLLEQEPHSLMKFYSASSASLFVANGTLVHLVGDPYVPQTLPFTPSGELWSHENLNGIMVATQRLGAEKPVFYNGQWLTMVLPKPTVAPTFAADTGGGSVDAGTHFYRVRWRYANGSSKVGPTSLARVVANPNNTVNLSANLVPGVPRSDYLGWRLERTKVNGDVNGPFYFVADGTAATYADVTSDANLGYRADEGLHGEPLHLDGITIFNDRLMGWAGSSLYLSQLTVDAEATGICNWDAELTYPVSKDDGDSIQTVVVVADQALILKRRSVHVLDGDTPESFRLTAVLAGSAARGAEAGAVGPRAAAAIGNSAFFYGDGGLFRYQRGTIKPFGWVELGHYKDRVNTAAIATTLLVNHVGDYLLVWLPMDDSPYPNEICVWDQRFSEWWHWDQWRARDAIVQKDAAFGGATMIFADPKAVEVDATNQPGANDPSAFIWVDQRSGINQIYCQKVLADGTANWDANGKLLSNSLVNGARGTGVASDYAGGWYFAWPDNATSTQATIRILRLASDGTPFPGWPPGGFPVAGVVDSANAIGVAPDGLGGCFVAFVAEVVGSNDLAYIARVGPSGTVLWTSMVRDALVTFDYLAVQPDGSGGCFVRNKATNDDDFIQKFSADGSALWTQGGVALTAALAGSWNEHQKFCLDVAGGVIVVGNNASARRLSATGATLWTVNYAPLSSEATEPAICPDLAGGGIIIWRDFRGSWGVYAQRLDEDGNQLWTVGGVKLHDGLLSFTPTHCSAIPDGLGGACLVWSHSVASGVVAVFAQRLSALGAPLWGATPLVLDQTADGSPDNYGPRSATDGASSIISIWCVSGNTSPKAQRVDSGGAQLWGTQGVDLTPGFSSPVQMPMIAFTGTPEGTLAVPPATEGFHLWAGIDGYGDERSVTGAGGKPTPAFFESPKLDGGMPERWKRLLRLNLDVETDLTVGASIIAEPGENATAITFDNAGSSAIWANDTVVNADDGVWDESEWGADESASLVSGIPPGVRCKRFRATIAAQCDRPFTLNGFDIDGVLLPRARTDR